MKTKVMMMALGLGLVALTSCDKDADDVIAQGTTTTEALEMLPQEARTVVSSFAGYTVSRTVQYRAASERGTLYESTLRPQVVAGGVVIDIEFDANGLWTDVDAENGVLPHDFIASLPSFPTAIVSYIRSNSLAVEEIERKAYGFKLDLTSDADLLFDKEGVLISGAGTGSGNGTTPTPDNGSAAKAQAFAAAHFPGYSIAYSKTEYDDGQTYTKYYLQQGYRNSYKLVYDAAGTLVEIEGDDDLRLYLPESALSAFLPAGAVSTLKSRNLLGTVAEVQLEYGRYVVDVPGRDLIFDGNGQFVGHED